MKIGHEHTNIRQLSMSSFRVTIRASSWLLASSLKRVHSALELPSKSPIMRGSSPFCSDVGSEVVLRGQGQESIWRHETTAEFSVAMDFSVRSGLIITNHRTWVTAESTMPNHGWPDGPHGKTWL